MAVEIKYNTVSLFLTQPTPFVSKDVEFIDIGGSWAQAETITLNGQLTGCSEADLIDARDELVSNLTSNFKTLEIDGVGDFLNVKIQNIQFSNSDYVNLVPYSISFLSYPESSFVNDYRVIEASDEISYKENPDRTLDITRNVSAKGINTDNSSIPGNGLQNAIDFVTEQIASSPVLPLIINSQSSDFSSYLISSEETLDKINNTASVSQSFRGDLDREGGNIVNRYSIEISEELGEFPIVTYNGQVNAGREGAIQSCYDEYTATKESISDASYLFNENVTQDTYINQLTYSFSFFSGDGASKIPKIEDDFSISVSEGPDSSLISVSVDGLIKLGYGCHAEDFPLVEEEFDKVTNDLAFHFDTCKDVYDRFYNTSRGSAITKPANVELNIAPLSTSSSKSEGMVSPLNLEMSYSAELDDRFVPTEFDPALTFQESVSITPPIRQKQISEHFVGGKYMCNDLGYLSREEIGISLSLGGDISLIEQEQCKAYADTIYNRLGSNSEKKLKSNNMSKSTQGKNISYDLSYSDRNEDEEFIIS